MREALLRRMKAKLWPPLPLWDHLYRAAFVTAVGAVAVLFLTLGSLFERMAVLCWALASSGFCIWLTNYAISLWRFPASRFVATWMHAGLLLLGYLMARWFVALGLGLPVKDFDGSVAVMTILCTILMYFAAFLASCVVVALGCLMLAPMLESAWIISTSPKRERLRLFLAKKFRIRFFNQPSNERKQTGINLFAHWIGGLCVVCGLGTAAPRLLDSSLNDPQLVKRIAYYVDYHFPARYPGVADGQHFILHDNNVISLARNVDGKIEIAVGLIDPLKGITLLSSYE